METTTTIEPNLQLHDIRENHENHLREELEQLKAQVYLEEQDNTPEEPINWNQLYENYLKLCSTRNYLVDFMSSTECQSEEMIALHIAIEERISENMEIH